ncbi:cyclic nucleotide-binding domain-containing protein [Flavobacterium sp. Sd200]|uniref:Crp/Fnr family transcriptional regulator n=1 Tax=Flavobacterium sp. Sd200 TaxID=2692211 RepID=UPI00136B765D|nr:Crp/Fnr family transcriptional regulator [Flavobacterium sp. Sd200]MXN90918.1 cyclic nucleotide-binding domain-containing protein [Flavobacterium sp. Sd200]
MDEFIKLIKTIYNVEDQALQQMADMLKTRNFRKGDFLVRADEVSKNYYFLSSGLVKLFFDNGDKNFIMTFFKEHSFFTELSSFNSGEPSKYMLSAIEPVELLYISKFEITKLCQQYHSIDTLFRKLNETASARMMIRISEFLECDAKNRYSNFLQHSPDLLQRISLGDLADYLGITQFPSAEFVGKSDFLSFVKNILCYPK